MPETKEYPISFDRLNDASTVLAVHRLSCKSCMCGEHCAEKLVLLKEQDSALNEIKNYIGPSREWLKQMADAEDACGGSVSVGGMAVDLGQPVNDEFKRQGKLYDDAIEALERDYRLHLRYVVESVLPRDKAYWRTFASGILHSLNKLKESQEKPQ
jgi:hypothetical protein